MKSWTIISKYRGSQMNLRTSLTTGIAALMLGSSAVRAEDTVKIGVIQPLTGSVAYNGTTDVNGIKLALSEINAKGGVLGKQVELVIEDGQGKPANSANAAGKLAQRAKGAGLTGEFCTSAPAATSPAAGGKKVPQ